MLTLQEQFPLAANATAGEVDCDLSDQGEMEPIRDAQCRPR
jgi:hypothetical protein